MGGRPSSSCCAPIFNSMFSYQRARNNRNKTQTNKVTCRTSETIAKTSHVQPRGRNQRKSVQTQTCLSQMTPPSQPSLCTSMWFAQLSGKCIEFDRSFALTHSVGMFLMPRTAGINHQAATLCSGTHTT